MTNEARITTGIILVTIGLVALLVWFGSRGTANSDLPSDIKDAVASNVDSYPVGDLVNEGDYSNGSVSAPVTLVEFSDFECPYCKEAFPIIEQLRDTFTGDQLRLVFRHVPIVEIHNEAYPAAKAAEAANRQGKFIEYATALFNNSASLSDATYISIAQQLGLDMDRFNADRASNDVAWQAYRARELFKQKGWQISTPTIVINGEVYSGQRSTEALTAYISGILGQ